MYQKMYQEIANDSQYNCRKTEHYILIKAINNLKNGLETGPDSIGTVKACAQIQNIWTIFMAELISNEEHLPAELRASLISIGIWIQRELEDILAGRSENYIGLIEINQIIADGLV